MYRYTQGTRNRSRGYNNNYRGNYNGNNRDQNRDQNGYRYQNQRDMISREEMNEKIHQAARMERFIANAGEHARDQRGYNRDNESVQSDVSFAKDGKSQISQYEDMNSRADSLELDFPPSPAAVPIENEPVTESNQEDEK